MLIFSYFEANPFVKETFIMVSSFLLLCQQTKFHEGDLFNAGTLLHPFYQVKGISFRLFRCKNQLLSFLAEVRTLEFMVLKDNLPKNLGSFHQEPKSLD